MGVQTVGYDKMNQLRHVRFLKNAAGVDALMKKHAAIIRPKFELVARMLEERLGNEGIATWTNPMGGYFVSFDGLEGTAKRTVEHRQKSGVTRTGAGSTWPYKQDPRDTNIRHRPYPAAAFRAAASHGSVRVLRKARRR